MNARRGYLVRRVWEEEVGLERGREIRLPKRDALFGPIIEISRGLRAG